MTAQTTVLRGRQAAEALMLDACTVRRVTGTSTNDSTGVVTPAHTTVYTGKCKLQRPAAGGRHDVAEASVVVAPLELHLPVAGSETVTVDDVATVTASAMDTGLIGRVLRVVGPAGASLRTARRLPVIEVAS